MGKFFDKIKDFIAPIEEIDEDEFQGDVESSVSTYEEPKNKKLKVEKNISKTTQMVLYEPRSFEEADEIAIHLKERKACVINLHRLQRDYAQRTIDFLTGVVFALDGTMQKVGKNVILCTPRGVGVAGEIKMTKNEEFE